MLFRSEVVGQFRLSDGRFQNDPETPAGGGAEPAPALEKLGELPGDLAVESAEVATQDIITKKIEVNGEELAAPADELSLNATEPGELSFEAMMNPVPRESAEASSPTPARGALPSLPSLPPGADPTAGGEEDAA